MAMNWGLRRRKGSAAQDDDSGLPGQCARIIGPEFRFSLRFAIRADHSFRANEGAHHGNFFHPRGVLPMRKLILPALIAVAFSVPAFAQDTPASSSTSSTTSTTTTNPAMGTSSTMSTKTTTSHKARHHHHHHAKTTT